MVGQRVVVRRLVRDPQGLVEAGPTGGPAFTDVLGTCLSWTPGASAVIEREDGVRVEIALADIVSGKPVPPRPSIRMRVSAREAEEHTQRQWPDVEATPLGEWSLRVNPHPVGRLLKRANSCLAIGDPGLPIADAAERIRSFYAGHDRRALAQVEADSPEERALAELGWVFVEDGETAYQLASVAHLARQLPRRPEASVTEATEGGVTTAHASIVRDGVEVARADAALDGDWVGVYGMAVEPSHRRQGLATDLLAALVGWAGQHGARTIWLHVLTDNAPALALYESLGFVTHHVCRYLTPPDAA